MSTMSEPHLVRSRGIYHSLPVYPPSLKGLTAIITGANGISGYYMLRALSQDPERWSKIYCLSRRPPAIPNGLPKNAEHIPLDFLKDKEEIASILTEKGVKADYVFFYSYVQVEPKEGKGLWSDAEEMCRVNVALLKNFCEALPLANIKPTRILLQTGAKNYGIHLGPALTPQEEHHPRVTLEPNFYYQQEDFLWSFCAAQGISWNVAMPSYILGAVPDAAMNLVYPLGIYAAVTKHLNQPLEFPSDLNSWEATHVNSSSMLNGYLEEWAVLTEEAENQRFNTVDGSPFTWGNFWPKFATWYGLSYSLPSLEPADYPISITTSHDPPPRGFGPPSTYRLRFTLVEWAKRPEVQRAWEEILHKYEMKDTKKLQDMNIERVFAFADGSLMGGTQDMSMNKARKMGWCGFVDTNECIKEVLVEFAGLGMLPPVGG
ncbi:hypothetical protein P280DRAFT_273298 [Massarina eburnea CBS 473.64]|uniref:PRISE-like Rossmann-fold domain-containing protein n=1 Tax=Massarina eburnea CBS 473.64 TaxID=1395130 RepID=A0A6A6S589_9PLEO|nr:hypothetical protein P280DRAFT_273298 [Massarina eburnea CBS 473.64]